MTTANAMTFEALVIGYRVRGGVLPQDAMQICEEEWL